MYPDSWIVNAAINFDFVDACIARSAREYLAFDESIVPAWPVAAIYHVETHALTTVVQIAQNYLANGALVASVFAGK